MTVAKVMARLEALLIELEIATSAYPESGSIQNMVCLTHEILEVMKKDGNAKKRVPKDLPF